MSVPEFGVYIPVKEIAIGSAASLSFSPLHSKVPGSHRCQHIPAQFNATGEELSGPTSGSLPL